MDIKVQVVGMGYIGLPTSICLAECFDYVHGCDIDSKKIEKISQYDVDKNVADIIFFITCSFLNFEINNTLT